MGKVGQVTAPLEVAEIGKVENLFLIAFYGNISIIAILKTKKCVVSSINLPGSTFHLISFNCLILFVSSTGMSSHQQIIIPTRNRFCRATSSAPMPMAVKCEI